MYCCLTPTGQCTGHKPSETSARIRNTEIKIHHSGKEANRCSARWLTSQGYSRLGYGRDFIKEGCPVITLPRVRRKPDFRRGKSLDGRRSSRIMERKGRVPLITG